MTPVDVLAIGAHPDDVELGIGGLLHKLVRRGRTVAIVDLTRGEMSSRGTVEERAVEAAEGARVLGVAHRENAFLPDGAIADTTEQQRTVIPFIRKYRPRLLLATMHNDRHPDHHAAHHLVRHAAYFSGLAKIDTGQEPFRPSRTYFFHPYHEVDPPQLIVDISDDFEAKLASLRAHASQFYNPAYEGRATHISSAAFWDSIQTRAAHWGARIGVRYGEALYAEDAIGVVLPPGLEE